MLRSLADGLWSTFPEQSSKLIRQAPAGLRKWSPLERLSYQSSFIKSGRQFRCWWARGPLPGNLGDLLTPLVLSRMFGIVPVFSHKRQFIGCGSIVDRAVAGTVVWGSGLISEESADHPEVRYLAVRGPLTRDELLRRGRQVPAVYGDPALLMPKVYQPQVDNSHAFGLMPHYKHQTTVRNLPDNWFFLNAFVGSQGQVYERINQLVACETIASSSLHGIILAVAYGRKFIWLRHPENLLVGDTFKFRDFFASIGLQDVEPVTWLPQEGLPSNIARYAIEPPKVTLAPRLTEVLTQHLGQAR